MRLTEAQRNQLLTTLRAVFGATAQVRVFGSRVDDSKRGGDYDVLVETDLDDADELVRRKLQSLAQLHATEAFEGEKIDLVVLSAIPGTRMPIHVVALKNGVLL